MRAMSSTAVPPPGFYDDPDKPGNERWWDGTQWTELTREKNEAEPESTGVTNKLLASVTDKLPDAQSAVGGALIADGLIGFGKNRVGIAGALGNLIVGIVVVIVTVFVVVPWMSGQTSIAAPVTVQAQVVTVDRFQSENKDEQGRVTSTSLVCTVTLEYSTQDDGRIQATTPYSSSSLCSRFVGETVAIQYDATSPGRFEGLDSMSDGFMKWFPWILVGVGALIALSGLWTLMLRATQIGGGIYLIARSRRKDHDKLMAKKSRT